ncbi:MAG: hypothetical protein V7744_00105 [Pseudomonadales bacterium]
MNILKKLPLTLLLGIVALFVGLNLWGFLSLGSLNPSTEAIRDDKANQVVMVFGATGSVGDGLLKAAIEDPDVEKIHVVTRRTSPRIDAGVASGKVEMDLLLDFTDYSSLANKLGQVNTVLWGLGTSSLNVDDATYTRIHVDFPVAFMKAWLATRTSAPMSFHFVAGMGTGADENAHWAQEKARTERELADMAVGTGLRTFSYRSAFVRPTSEQANVFHHLLDWLLRPGKLVITATDLGAAMLEISARPEELANGTLIDNADSIAYAQLYRN